jgi:ubiquitin-protein ligase
MFVHDGPYADAILKFTINFELDFPKSSPTIKFGPDVYHRKS